MTDKCTLRAGQKIGLHAFAPPSGESQSICLLSLSLRSVLGEWNRLVSESVSPALSESCLAHHAEVKFRASTQSIILARISGLHRSLVEAPIGPVRLRVPRLGSLPVAEPCYSIGTNHRWRLANFACSNRNPLRIELLASKQVDIERGGSVPNCPVGGITIPCSSSGLLFRQPMKGWRNQ